jgi:hypothetical protein
MQGQRTSILGSLYLHELLSVPIERFHSNYELPQHHIFYCKLRA